MPRKRVSTQRNKECGPEGIMGSRGSDLQLSPRRPTSTQSTPGQRPQDLVLNRPFEGAQSTPGRGYGRVGAASPGFFRPLATSSYTPAIADSTVCLPDQTFDMNRPANRTFDMGSPANRTFDMGSPANRTFDMGSPANRTFDMGSPANRTFDMGSPANRTFDMGTPANRTFNMGSPANRTFDMGTPANRTFDMGTPANRTFTQPRSPRTPRTRSPRTAVSCTANETFPAGGGLLNQTFNAGGGGPLDQTFTTGGGPLDQTFTVDSPEPLDGTIIIDRSQASAVGDPFLAVISPPNPRLHQLIARYTDSPSGRSGSRGGDETPTGRPGVRHSPRNLLGGDETPTGRPGVRHGPRNLLGEMNEGGPPPETLPPWIVNSIDMYLLKFMESIAGQGSLGRSCGLTSTSTPEPLTEVQLNDLKEFIRNIIMGFHSHGRRGPPSAVCTPPNLSGQAGGPQTGSPDRDREDPVADELKWASEKIKRIFRYIITEVWDTFSDLDKNQKHHIINTLSHDGAGQSGETQQESQGSRFLKQVLQWAFDTIQEILLHLITIKNLFPGQRRKRRSPRRPPLGSRRLPQDLRNIGDEILALDELRIQPIATSSPTAEEEQARVPASTNSLEVVEPTIRNFLRMIDHGHNTVEERRQRLEQLRRYVCRMQETQRCQAESLGPMLCWASDALRNFLHKIIQSWELFGDYGHFSLSSAMADCPVPNLTIMNKCEQIKCIKCCCPPCAEGGECFDNCMADCLQKCCSMGRSEDDCNCACTNLCIKKCTKTAETEEVCGCDCITQDRYVQLLQRCTILARAINRELHNDMSLFGQLVNNYEDFLDNFYRCEEFLRWTVYYIDWAWERTEDLEDALINAQQELDCFMQWWRYCYCPGTQEIPYEECQLEGICIPPMPDFCIDEMSFSTGSPSTPGTPRGYWSPRVSPVNQMPRTPPDLPVRVQCWMNESSRTMGPPGEMVRGSPLFLSPLYDDYDVLEGRAVNQLENTRNALSPSPVVDMWAVD